MVDVRIYKPSRNIMQSASNAESQWHVAYNKVEKKQTDPIMGWTSSSQTSRQMDMVFESLEEAKKYCDDKKLSYIIIKPSERKVNIHPYAHTLMRNPNL